MTIQIQIRKNQRGNLSAIFCNYGIVNQSNTLFEFANRTIEEKPYWLFWLNPCTCHSSHKFEGRRKDFPLDFFINACKAKYFLHPRGGEMPDNVEITYGLGHIGNNDYMKAKRIIDGMDFEEVKALPKHDSRFSFGTLDGSEGEGMIDLNFEGVLVTVKGIAKVIDRFEEYDENGQFMGTN